MKKRTIQLIIFLAFLFIPTVMLYAIPANPNPVLITQPNETSLTIMIKGDERVHWYKSMDDYTLLYNEAGYLSYAQLDENGDLQPTNYIATDIDKRDIIVTSFLNTIDKNLFFSDIQVQVMLEIWKIEDEYAEKSSKGEVPVNGTYKTICAFVEFPEKKMIKTISDFEGLLTHLGYTENGSVGSVRDYFRESSYGKFDLLITLCGPYTAPQSESFYAGSSGSAQASVLAKWLAERVAQESGMDFRNYDSDNDKYVDGFHFIFAGRGQEGDGGAGTIWSHKGRVAQDVINNGIKISIYSCSPELISTTRITTIGVICHEMTHAICKAPDYYDTDYATNGQYNGMGNWDLMANGSWNGTLSGNCPAHHNMYTKIQCGWVVPVELNAPNTITDMPNSAENPVAYKIKTATNNEYFLLENRQKIKFDKSIPGSGLLIYHVHSQQVGGINDTHPQRMYPVCASRTTQMPNATPSSYGDINKSTCPFGVGKTEFTDSTTPAMWSWANKKTEKPVTEIVQQNKMISFKFMGGANAIHDTEQEAYFTINPNPANDYIDVNFSREITGNIEIYNLAGKLVKSVVKEHTDTQRISLTDLSKDIYFIKIGNGTAKLLVR
jgi:M6 family metalloprotease-like protein